MKTFNSFGSVMMESKTLHIILVCILVWVGVSWAHLVLHFYLCCHW